MQKSWNLDERRKRVMDKSLRHRRKEHGAGLREGEGTWCKLRLSSLPIFESGVQRHERSGM